MKEEIVRIHWSTRTTSPTPLLRINPRPLKARPTKVRRVKSCLATKVTCWSQTLQSGKAKESSIMWMAPSLMGTSRQTSSLRVEWSMLRVTRSLERLLIRGSVGQANLKPQVVSRFKASSLRAWWAVSNSCHFKAEIFPTNSQAFTTDPPHMKVSLRLKRARRHWHRSRWATKRKSSRKK